MITRELCTSGSFYDVSMLLYKGSVGSARIGVYGLGLGGLGLM